VKEKTPNNVCFWKTTQKQYKTTNYNISCYTLFAQYKKMVWA